MKNEIVNSLDDIDIVNINDWVYISNSLFLSESFISTYQDKVDWMYIVTYQKLSESFIEKHSDKVDLRLVGIYQVLSESFIEKHQGKLHWHDISKHQNLSESFIEKHQDKINWSLISEYQKLSESFIEKHQDKVTWYNIFINQILSEEFIEKHYFNAEWRYISFHQKLSESFIEKHQDKVDWGYIFISQNLSQVFIDKYKHKLDGVDAEELYNTSHRVMTYEERLEDITNYANRYGLEFDGKYLYAYRNHDILGRGMWNKTIRYEVGKYYRDWHCDMDISESNSFGLGIFPDGNVKVKVDIDDWGLDLNSFNGKCRVWGFEVLKDNSQ